MKRLGLLVILLAALGYGSSSAPAMMAPTGFNVEGRFFASGAFSSDGCGLLNATGPGPADGIEFTDRLDFQRSVSLPPDEDPHDEDPHDEDDNEAEALYRSLKTRLARAVPADLKELEHDLIAAADRFTLDYRFPYEHSKLAVTGRIEHHASFKLLFDAAERAIKTEDSNLMLHELHIDGAEGGPLHKLARGHAEWGVLEEALEHRDPRGLLGEHGH